MKTLACGGKHPFAPTLDMIKNGCHVKLVSTTHSLSNHEKQIGYLSRGVLKQVQHDGLFEPRLTK